MAIIPRLLAEESISVTVASVLKERKRREGGKKVGREERKEGSEGGNGDYLSYDYST